MIRIRGSNGKAVPTASSVQSEKKKILVKVRKLKKK